MASLKDLRNRITSVKATQKITKAMQMVAAAKLRRAQMAAEAGRPYAEKMSAVLGNLAGNLVGGVGAPRLLSGTGSEQTHLLVVCTGDRGLAGAFNSSIVRLAVREHAQKLAAEGKTVKIMTVGKKGLDALRRQYRDQIVESMDIRGNRPVDYDFAASIADKILTRFENGEFDVATLFYSEFRSVISQIPTAQRLIPAELPPADATAKATAGNAALEFEPSEEAILETLLPKNLTVQIYRALLENAASEQGARMSAMDSATRNAGEMIKKQTLIYNRTRQAMITKELIEIISGAEAL
ncbi:ATP synthase gamma chain [Methylobacterium tardum]|jgi:F-type H+-transporting ATPase subunit gamma|uniref:ATP synthase gamma chain n=1 Tax=Methylobacterium tardum TaxID=374432 RepID=A0AA37TTK3_9HYPH|nr:F0F1 ATP synthase subunit gamma [Methylobacterium tardum]URD39271.1 F0F1 ATP synthase subunit gamma [Methylobacterium tardum]GJE48857.1 ATP synthase gamma chain [Methylobacterium tardum]GLS73998.1 ATP synthase gamma chain [Methylobacterium tardum]